MRFLRTALIGLLALLAAPAAAQLPNIQNRAVWGRIGSSTDPNNSGPSQAIPFLNLQQQLGVHTLPEIYASDPAYGMKCDGQTDNSPALQLAINAAALVTNGTGVTVVLPAGQCEFYSNVWLNASGPPGTLTVPGLKIRGQGRGVTKLDTHVANDYLISVNPAWEAAHQAAYRTTVGTSGSLGSVTIYLQITANDGLGHEILVTAPKSFSITGPSGSLSIPIPALSNPGYTYNFYCDTVSPPAHYCGLGGGDATGRTPGSTVGVTAIGSAHALPTALQAVWQEASISDLSITNSSGTANASGISYFKVGFSNLTRVYLKGLTGDGFDLFAYTGDNDGSFGVGIHDSKFDTINGTCVNAAGTVLELTNFTVDDRTAFNVCGTPPTNIGTNVTVSAIPNSSSPSVTTSTAHNFQPGDQVAFNVTGITLAGPFYRVGTAVTSNTFNLVDTNGVAVNTTSLGAFVSGTVSLSWRPPQIVNGVLTGGGGCLAWMGLIGTFRNLDFTQCNNFSMYFSELGSSDNATIENVDFENTAGVGAYIASLLGGTLKNFECLTTAGLGNTLSCVQLGTGFAGGGVSNFLIDVGKVRSNVAPSIAFTQLQNTNIGATFQDTNRVRNITWQAFDATNQTRVSGFVNDPIPGMVQFSISAQNTAKLISLGYGGCLPLHLKAPGEWVCYHVPNTGITGSVTGSLTPATSYNCYAYNSATNTSPYSISFECGSTATSIDKDGYSVKSTDTSRTFIGTATTDGSGNFQTSGAQTSWYPPSASSAAGNFTVPGNLTVVGTSNLNGVVTDGNGQLMTNTVAPATPAAGSTRVYVDSTQKVLSSKNDAGTVSNTVVPSTCSSHNWFNTLSAGGVLGCSQPAFTDISGTLSTLTFGTHLTSGGASYNGSLPITITSDATSANTASTIVARDPSNNFSAGTITASLTGVASGDCQLTGGAACTMSGNIAMGGHSITGLASASLTTPAISLSTANNALGADVLLNNTSNYFDGPSMGQGTSGTWLAFGKVTVVDTGAAASISCKLWDGTTVIDSANTSISAAGLSFAMTLAGFIASPAANIKISCRDASNTTGKIQFNNSGLSKDSSLTAFRIN